MAMVSVGHWDWQDWQMEQSSHESERLSFLHHLALVEHKRAGSKKNRNRCTSPGHPTEVKPRPPYHQFDNAGVLRGDLRTGDTIETGMYTHLIAP